MKTFLFTIVFTILFGTTYSYGQTFSDNFSQDQVGDFPSKWDLLQGSAQVDELYGTNIIRLGNEGTITPLLGNDDYLSEEFTIEFDIFFDEVRQSIDYQSYELRLWPGVSSVSIDNGESTLTFHRFKVHRYGIVTSYRDSGPQKGREYSNYFTELKTHNPVWRNIKIQYKKGHLKVLMDDQLVLNIPRYQYDPSAISIEGNSVDGKGELIKAIKSFRINGLQNVENTDSTNTSTRTESGIETPPTREVVHTSSEVGKTDSNNIPDGNSTQESLDIHTRNQTEDPFHKVSEPYVNTGHDGNEGSNTPTENATIESVDILTQNQETESLKKLPGPYISQEPTEGTNESTSSPAVDTSILDTPISGSTPTTIYQPTTGDSGNQDLSIIDGIVSSEEPEESTPSNTNPSPNSEERSSTNNAVPTHPTYAENPADIQTFTAAVLDADGRANFFWNLFFHKYNSSTRSSHIGMISLDGWAGIGGNIHAALKHPTENLAYIFRGTKYYRYNFKINRVEKEGTIGQDGWRGVPSVPDAALVHPINKNAYFFKGSKYYRYNFSSKNVDKIGNINVDGWRGVPVSVDLALMHSNGKAYFFKDDYYYRFDFTKDHIDKIGLIGVDGWRGVFKEVQGMLKDEVFMGEDVLSAKPRQKPFVGVFGGGWEVIREKNKIESIYEGIPPNVDAVLQHPNGSLYFFKDEKYYKYKKEQNIVNEVGLIGKDYWYPIPPNIDAAFSYDDRKGYLFKGDTYYLFDYNTNTVQEKGKIKDRWKGVPNFIDAVGFVDDTLYRTLGLGSNVNNRLPYILTFFKNGMLYLYDESTQRVVQHHGLDSFFKEVN